MDIFDVFLPRKSKPADLIMSAGVTMPSVLFTEEMAVQEMSRYT